MSGEQDLNYAIGQLNINVAVLTQTVTDLRALLEKVQSNSATKESHEQLAETVKALSTKVDAVDEKHEKKWDRLTWLIVSAVILAIVTFALGGGLVK